MTTSTATRLQRLESERNASLPFPVAVVDVVGMTDEQAETAIADKRQELCRGGYRGTLVILDA